jgi:hypothetical protein
MVSGLHAKNEMLDLHIGRHWSSHRGSVRVALWKKKAPHGNDEFTSSHFSHRVHTDGYEREFTVGQPS